MMLSSGDDESAISDPSQPREDNMSKIGRII
jgi:hypothetical protein